MIRLHDAGDVELDSTPVDTLADVGLLTDGQTFLRPHELEIQSFYDWVFVINVQSATNDFSTGSFSICRERTACKCDR